MAYDGRNHPSILEAFRKLDSTKKVQEQCSKDSLICLHEAFLAAENQQMSLPQFYDAFVNTLHIKMSDEDFNILFRKVNINQDDFITWDEFISYLLVEFQEKDISLQWQTLQLPLSGPPKMLRSRHRSSVCRIAFCPEVLPNRTVSFRNGCYITASRDGFINYWSLDLDYRRSVQSVNPYLRVQPTVITDMVVMADVQIICTSSTERDLRFYDTVAEKFDLRILISSLDSAVVAMHYYFSTNVKEESYIVLGDTSGSIMIMTFVPIDKGPFKHKSEQDTQLLRYDAVLKGGIKGLQVIEIKNVHKNWVTQVAYYGTLKAFMSSSRCSDYSLLFSDPTRARMEYKFSIRMGISCFELCEESLVLVTGSPDCKVRVWNPFVPTKASVIFQGHNTAICAVVLQNDGNRIYSLSNDRCIKVWDVPGQTCIQTYNGIPSELSEYTPMSIVYNSLTHKMIVASIMIAVLVCDQVINREISDGYTHTKSVSCILYNNLYQVVVSMGHDSCIIVWNPWMGKRLNLITNAHGHISHGEFVCSEITAASFDPSEQFLITGAHDGTVKVWNFNTGTCLKKMAIEDQCEVTSIAWIENRILCTGWNRRVTEFAVSGTDIFKKSWSIRHTEDILCSAVRAPQTIATASYNGELILWRLETGQPYRRYQVNNATGRYNVMFETTDKRLSTARRKTYTKDEIVYVNGIRLCPHQRSVLSVTRTVSTCSMIFLTKRPVKPNVGTLLVSLESGLIQVWTHHPGGGFLAAFSVIHSVGDNAVSITTDPDNNYLFTGHRAGYIKVWLLSNYVTDSPPKLCMPLLRLEFPFLWKDKIDGRAKRAVRNQTLPMLLSSFKAHMKAVNSIEIIPEVRMIISGSSDHTVRLWTYGGRYISTLGTFREWSPILPTKPLYRYFDNYRMPPDIERVGSFTTMKVFRGGLREVQREGEIDDTELTKEVPEQEQQFLYGRKLTTPILGRGFKLPTSAQSCEEPINLDNSLEYIPIYAHLKTYAMADVEKVASSHAE